MEKWTCSGAMCLKIVAFAVEHRSHNVQNKEDGLGQVTWYMPVDGFLGVVGLATSCADIGKVNPKITSLITCFILSLGLYIDRTSQKNLVYSFFLNLSNI